MSAAETPSPGDAIFFRETVPGRRGITHVAIFLGTTRQGRALILHASSRSKPPRVLFTSMTEDLRKKIAGYGNISQLYLALR
jgi:cell wall-associated NlpC family hydrolase